MIIRTRPVNGNNVSQIGGDTFKSKDAFQITLQGQNNQVDIQLVNLRF